MIVAETVTALAGFVARAREGGRRIAFVPTMGNLHRGHLALVERARELADLVVASIYVNPLQFGPAEDFGAYPRTVESDRQALEGLGVDLLFLPAESQMYPRGSRAQTFVEVPGISDELCGAFRPGHFRGVTTVVNRLFNLVAPQVAVFGKKDYQQLFIIRLMVADLGLPVEVVGVDTVREPDGLALSSRNAYLSAAERARAPGLYRTLGELCAKARAAGGIPPGLEETGMQRLREGGFTPQYVAVRRRRDLRPPQPGDRALVVLAAAMLGRTRLIDNLEFELNASG